MRYVNVKNGEGFEVKAGEKFLLECGDCGCVREVGVAVEDSKVGLAFQVNEEQTAARRGMSSAKARIRRLAKGI
jgi:hypothetical protein